MLPKEKRRVGWSLAVGFLVAGLVAGYYYLQAFEANRQLPILVAACEKQRAGNAPAADLQPGESEEPLSKGSTEVPIPPGATIGSEERLPNDFIPDECDPKVLVASQADNDRDDGRDYALIAFLIFCLPLVWYLVLDRIRELSAAIAGGDRGL
jgi:hypothetical protein